ncbi:UBL7 [Cordylochernes scorpioides]|uniref:UBL7 n=1 Tax=Cordylochernes scorpioides TaxID=51811 RepID=A0ABY6KKF2_9ARAC|nr:UBL7 [Cordylochernes scorpioides]
MNQLKATLGELEEDWQATKSAFEPQLGYVQTALTSSMLPPTSTLRQAGRRWRPYFTGKASSTDIYYPLLSDLGRKLQLRRRGAILTIICDNAGRIKEERANISLIFRRVTLKQNDLLYQLEISHEQIASATQRLPLGKEAGWDELPYKIIQRFEEFFLTALHQVFEASQLCESLLPSMRGSEVFPVSKPHGGLGLNRLRPISLPPMGYQRIVNTMCCADPICFGFALKDEQSLESYGITSGTFINVFQREAPPPVAELSLPGCVTEVTGRDLAKLQADLKVTTLAMWQIRKPETIDALLTAIPALEQDYMATGIMQDIDMIRMLAAPDNLESYPLFRAGQVSLGDISCGCRILQDHRVLREALQASFNMLQQEPSSSSGHISYSLDSLSDDDMEDQSWFTIAMFTITMGVAMSGPITPAHLANALASVVGNAPAPPGSTPITAEMFSQAMQNALGAVGTPSLQVGSPPAQTYTGQLQQMREMGITDEAVSVQALEATGGDVNAAIDFIFNMDTSQDPPPSS